MLHARRSFTTIHPLEEADVCFLGVPFDSTSLSSPLQRYGPTLMRAALNNSNFYSPDTGESVDLKIHDAGDVDVTHGSFEKTDERVRDTIGSLMENNPDIFPMVMGGEHSISLSVVRELEPATIVSFDAHTDLHDEYGNLKYSHATWLYHAHQELDAELVLLGARAWPEELEDRMEEFNVRRELPDSLEGPVYVSLDMDVFDPAYVPETGFPEPDGPSPEQVFDLIDTVFQEDVVGMDVVEVTSSQLGCPTAELAARTITRALTNL